MCVYVKKWTGLKLHSHKDFYWGIALTIVHVNNLLQQQYYWVVLRRVKPFEQFL